MILRAAAARGFANIEIVVKPGMVLISFTKTSPVARLSRKSTRASPAPSIDANASSACARIAAASASPSGAGISRRDPPSRYLAS